MSSPARWETSKTCPGCWEVELLRLCSTLETREVTSLPSRDSTPAPLGDEGLGARHVPPSTQVLTSALHRPPHCRGGRRGSARCSHSAKAMPRWAPSQTRLPSQPSGTVTGSDTPNQEVGPDGGRSTDVCCIIKRGQKTLFVIKQGNQDSSNPGNSWDGCPVAA